MIEDVGGGAIVLIGTKGGLVEGNSIQLTMILLCMRGLVLEFGRGRRKTQ